MKRSCWQRLRQQDGNLIPLDLEKTPLNKIGLDTHVEAAVIRQATERVKITIYRKDPKDAPTEINTDNYSVHEGLPSNLDVNEMIETASTAPDPNFWRYVEDHIFIVKDNPGNDHWLETLPRNVAVLIQGMNY